MASLPARAFRRTTLPRRIPHAVRYQSDSRGPSVHMDHVISGLIGGTAVLIGGYALYSYSAAGRLHSSLNKSAKSAQEYYKSAANQFQESTPDANEAIEYLRKTAYSYASFIPGGRGYVDTVFKDVDAVREKHGDKVEEIVKEGYGQLQDVAKDIGKGGLSIAAISKVMEVLQGITTRIGKEAGGMMGSLVDNHPKLKEQFGGQFEQLKNMGESFGPEAKQKVEETWSEISDALKGGLSTDSMNKVKKIVEEKVQELQKYGDQAWQKGLEQAKPYLDKNPKVKQLVEENADALKKGNTTELFQKVKSSIDSGSIDELKSYISSLTSQTQQAGNDAWTQALQRAQPYLDKSPKVKQLLDQNADALKKGDTKQLFEKVKRGVETGNMNDLNAYVDEAKNVATKMADDAWKEAMRMAKPWLDKNPKLKEVLEQNEEALKKGDAKELFERVKQLASSGTLESVKGYVEEAMKKATK